MNEDKTRLAAANLLLERGVRFKIDAPFFLRWFRLNRITIRPLYPGTIVEFSRVLLSCELENATPEKATDQIENICKIIAIAMLNDEQKIQKNTDRLAKRLLWKVPTNQLIKIFLHIQSINSTLDFTIITNSFSAQMNQMMTMRNLGQNQKGS